MLEPEEAKKLPKYTKNPLELPKHLQEPANYKPIQKKLFGILQSTHSHAEIIDWFNCAPCMERFRKYKEEKKKLGFVSTGQWMKWQRINHPKK